MKKTTTASRSIIGGLIMAATLPWMTACVTTSAPDRLVEQSTQSVLWLQNAGEYQALCHQAFNAGKTAVDQIKATQTQPWAIMVDLDETMIDNSPYAAWLLLNNDSYAPATWKAWCEAAEAPAIPGAVDFANYVTAQGGAVFYVSNRTIDTLEVTMQNLRQLNFPEVNASRVFLQTNTSNKQARLQQIEDAGYQVELFVGDNLNDFPELGTWHQNNATRNQAMAAKSEKFGKRLIVLPNPSYGDWEGGMSDGYHGLSEEEKIQVRRESLKAWSGE